MLNNVEVAGTQRLSGKFENLQIVRLVAFLGIMLYHMGTLNSHIESLQAGVNLFFCLSGFFAMYSTRTNANGYLCKRLIRIVPLYWLMTMLTYIAAQAGLLTTQGAVGTKELVKSLFFVPYLRSSMKGTVEYARPIVGPAWTLYYEILFALIFALAVKLSKERRAQISIVALSLLCLGGKIWPNSSVAIITILFDKKIRWLNFIAGILAYELLERSYLSDRKYSKGARWAGGILITILFVSLFALHQNQPIDALLSLGIVFTSVFVFKNTPMPRLLVHLGDISFSSYLVHYYYIAIVGKVVDWTQFNFRTLIGFFVVMLMTFVTAHFSYEIIEKKFGNYLRGILIRK